MLTLGGLAVLMATGTHTWDAEYPLGIPSAAAKEPALLMLTGCFSAVPEIFRGTSYIGVRTNTTIKIALKK